MGNAMTLRQKAEKFQSHVGATILFVARTATNDELRGISKFKWSCIYTSRTDVDILEPLEAKGFVNRIPANPSELLYNSENQNLVRVFREDEDEPGEYFLDTAVFPSIQRLLKDGLNRLVVVGYDYSPKSCKENKDVNILDLLRQPDMQASSVEFWGISDFDMATLLEKKEVLFITRN